MRAVHQILGGFGVDARQFDVQACLDQIMAFGRAEVHLGVHRDIECPYSKATHGNINVETNLIDAGAAAFVT